MEKTTTTKAREMPKKQNKQKSIQRYLFSPVSTALDLVPFSTSFPTMHKPFINGKKTKQKNKQTFHEWLTLHCYKCTEVCHNSSVISFIQSLSWQFPASYLGDNEKPNRGANLECLISVDNCHTKKVQCSENRNTKLTDHVTSYYLHRQCVIQTSVVM